MDNKTVEHVMRADADKPKPEQRVAVLRKLRRHKARDARQQFKPFARASAGSEADVAYAIFGLGNKEYAGLDVMLRNAIADLRGFKTFEGGALVFETAEDGLIKQELLDELDDLDLIEIGATVVANLQLSEERKGN